MFLQDNQEYLNPSEDKIHEYERLKKDEIIRTFGSIETRKSLFHKYPIEVRHWLSLFPKNYLDLAILKDTDLHQKIANEFYLTLENKNVSENEVLRFLKGHNNYLLVSSLLKKYYNFGHHDAYLFPEFQLGNSYVADFLIVGKNSDGWHFVFVELESPNGLITNSDGEIGMVFRKWITQINDWIVWLEKSYSCLRETFDKCKKSGDILPNEFNDLDSTRLNYIVVAGRRINFKDKTYRIRRKMCRESNILLLHYDNLIDAVKEISGQQTY